MQANMKVNYTSFRYIHTKVGFCFGLLYFFRGTASVGQRAGIGVPSGCHVTSDRPVTITLPDGKTMSIYIVINKNAIPCTPLGHPENDNENI